MDEHDLSDRKLKIGVVLAVAIIGWLCLTGASASHAQTIPANLSPGVQEVLKLSQAHMSDDVIAGLHQEFRRVLHVCPPMTFFISIAREFRSRSQLLCSGRASATPVPGLRTATFAARQRAAASHHPARHSTAGH
jgi:hypothetical protein